MTEAEGSLSSRRSATAAIVAEILCHDARMVESKKRLELANQLRCLVKQGRWKDLADAMKDLGEASNADITCQVTSLLATRLARHDPEFTQSLVGPCRVPG